MMTEQHSQLQSSIDWLSLADLAIVVAVLVAVKQALLPYTQLYAGPTSTLTAMIVATVLLHRRGKGWVALGFTRPKGLASTVGLDKHHADHPCSWPVQHAGPDVPVSGY